MSDRAPGDDARETDGTSETGTGTDTESDGTPASGGSETATDPDRSDDDRPVEYLKWAGVAVLAVTALVALVGFYIGVSRVISVWVTSEYRPLVNAAFNLALLLAALGGIGLLLRRGD